MSKPYNSGPQYFEINLIHIAVLVERMFYHCICSMFFFSNFNGDKNSIFFRILPNKKKGLEYKGKPT